MRKLIPVVVLAFALSACTPGEVNVWKSWFAKDPVAAKVGLSKVHTEKKSDTGPVPAKAPMGSKCPAWFDEAMDAGFTYQEWRHIDKIMWRESRCQQGAHNRSGASGLLQIMPMWARRCGTTPAGLHNGVVNLRCAVHILHTQGWQAWSTA